MIERRNGHACDDRTRQSKHDAERPVSVVDWAERDHGPRAHSIERLNCLPSAIDIPVHPSNVLIGHLAGPFYVEAGGPDERGERRWIAPGQVGVNVAGQPIRRRFKGKPEVAVVHLDAEILRTTIEDVFDLDPAHVHLTPKLAEKDEVADQLIRLLLREAEGGMTGATLAIEGLSRALVVHVLRSHSNLSAPRSPGQPILSPARLRRVSEFMSSNLDVPLSLRRLADVAGLSSSHFARAFRRATGQTPHRFLVALRITKACELLKETDMLIIEVGLRCGFTQASHFTSTFRAVVGVPPREWRRLRRS